MDMMARDWRCSAQYFSTAWMCFIRFIWNAIICSKQTHNRKSVHIHEYYFQSKFLIYLRVLPGVGAAGCCRGWCCCCCWCACHCCKTQIQKLKKMNFNKINEKKFLRICFGNGTCQCWCACGCCHWGCAGPCGGCLTTIWKQKLSTKIFSFYGNV